MHARFDMLVEQQRTHTFLGQRTHAGAHLHKPCRQRWRRIPFDAGHYAITFPPVFRWRQQAASDYFLIFNVAGQNLAADSVERTRTDRVKPLFIFFRFLPLSSNLPHRPTHDDGGDDDDDNTATMSRASVVTGEDRADYVQRHYSKTPEELESMRSHKQRTPGWKDARRFRITGSVINLVWEWQKLLLLMLWPDEYEKRHPIPPEFGDWGTDLEPGATETCLVALRLVLAEQGYDNVWIEEVNLHVDPERQYLGVSSDGLIYATGPGLPLWRATLEIKCPWTQQVYAQVPAKHYDQFMAAGNLLGVDNVVYFVYTPQGCQLGFYKTNTVYWQRRLLPALDRFFKDIYLPLAILKERGQLTPGQIAIDVMMTTPIVSNMERKQEQLREAALQRYMKNKPQPPPSSALDIMFAPVSMEGAVDYAKAPRRPARPRSTRSASPRSVATRRKPNATVST
jgi:hypothetical protein